MNQAGHKVALQRIGLRPVQPTQGVVLAVGVVVALLAVAYLVAGQQLRRALRAEQGGEQGTAPLAAQGQHGRITAGAFHAGVGAEVVRVPVAVVFAIGLVVFVGVGGEVGQGHAVVRGDEVDAGLRAAATVVKHIAGATQAARQLAARGFVPKPPGAATVAKAVVPLQPAQRKVAQLVAIGPQVPGLGNQTHARQHRVLRHGRQQPGVRLKVVVCAHVAPQRGGQVKAKTVHPKGLHPPAQAVHHQALGAGLRQVQAVAAAAEVEQVAGALMQVPTGVVEPAPAQGGPEGVALGAVVEDHVQHHLQTVAVQLVHHVTKLGAHVGVQAAGVGGLGHKEVQRVVAPVVAQAFVQQVRLGQVLVHRQQAQRGDA